MNTTTAPSAPVAATAPTTGPLADKNKNLDGSEISKGLSAPQAMSAAPSIAGVDYSLFQGPMGSADGATGNSGDGVGGTGGVGGNAASGTDSGEGGSGGGYTGGPVSKLYNGGRVMARYYEGGGSVVAPSASAAENAGIARRLNSIAGADSGSSQVGTQDYGGYELGPYRDWAIQVGRDVGAFKAHGGQIHANQAMANHLASQGRGRDTVLVHMSRPEVEGLGSLHPTGKMPINPKTGLPEADFLTDILPGVAGTILGTAVGMPWLGAAAGGLGTWAATGNLGKGILSGLMSFGLGSIGGQLAGAGASAAGETATKGASDVVAEAAKTASQLPGAASGINPATFADPMAQGAAQAASIPGAGAGAAAPSSGFLGNLANKFSSANMGQNLSNVGQGLLNPQNIDPTKMIMPGVMAGSGMLGLAQANQQPAAIPNPMTQQQGQYHGTPSNVPFRTYTGGTPPPGAGPGYQGELSYFAPNPAYQLYVASGGPIKAYATGGGVMNDGGAYELAKGGVADLPSGLIRGPGAGMDDKIKGTIDGRRDVYLSDGEYVVDAQTVSALGDGSSEAGAKRMKNIVEEIRQKKFGSKKQPAKINMGGIASLV